MVRHEYLKMFKIHSDVRIKIYDFKQYIVYYHKYLYVHERPTVQAMILTEFVDQNHCVFSDWDID